MEKKYALKDRSHQRFHHHPHFNHHHQQHYNHFKLWSTTSPPSKTNGNEPKAKFSHCQSFLPQAASKSTQTTTLTIRNQYAM
ncbi:hypothetical protein ACTXT7_005925 [Hymenolepis weldensis]